jgi:hypothetical protein
LIKSLCPNIDRSARRSKARTNVETARLRTARRALK